MSFCYFKKSLNTINGIQSEIRYIYTQKKIRNCQQNQKIIEINFIRPQEKMSNMFVIDFDSDSASEKEQVTQETQSLQNNSFTVKENQDVILKTNQKKKDKYVSNQISKNILFSQEDDYYINNHEPQQTQISQSVVQPSKKQTIQKKSIRRVKVDSGIKLQPLKNLELTKKTQTISLFKQPGLNKTQSLPQSYLPTQFLQSNFSLTSSVQKEKVLNFQMGSSSEEQENEVPKKDFKTPKKNLNKLDLQLSANVFFQDSDQQKNSDERQSQQKEQNQQKDKKNNKTLKKKRSTQKKNNQKSQQGQEIVSQQDQNEQQQSDSEEAKVNFQNQPNPQMQKKQSNQPTVLNSQQQTLNRIDGRGFHQKSQMDSVKGLLLNDLIKNSVLNLKLKRKSSLLGFFGPQFRIELHQDKYFLMNSKKTSSKPSSTFTFSASQATYEQFSNKFLGKLKSNVGGSVYNIYGPGLNPSDAKYSNTAPRQLLATVSYRTQFLGTTRPKQLVVFAKKPEYLYYRDFHGVRMYDEQIPLSELYEKYPQNRQKMFIFQTRRPIYHPETKEYVMNFEGKVKISSVKNFILEDRKNNSQKVLLFGKVTQNDFVLDIHSPLAPIVGIGVALTMFDTRIGSD